MLKNSYLMIDVRIVFFSCALFCCCVVFVNWSISFQWLVAFALLVFVSVVMFFSFWHCCWILVVGIVCLSRLRNKE